MNTLLAVAQIYIPNFIKKKKLIELFQLTADSFQSDMPIIKNLSYDECLKAYANFSKTKAKEIINSKANIDVVKNRLYQNAHQLGKKLRKDFRIKTYSDVILCCKIIYKILKIDFTGKLNGNVNIKYCFFSQFYTPDVCEIISSLDNGLAAGLSDGGELVFKERITEGAKCCSANFSFEAKRS